MKLVLRACAAPLRPSHLACFLQNAPGSGFSVEETPHMEEAYRRTAMIAMEEDAAQSKDFLAAVQGMVFHATNKAVSRLTVRNQFLGLAPKMTLATILCGSDGIPVRGDGLQVALVKRGADDVRIEEMEEALAGLMPRPFVMMPALQEQLETARLVGREQIGASRLRGFVEQHMGAACVLTCDR